MDIKEANEMTDGFIDEQNNWNEVRARAFGYREAYEQQGEIIKKLAEALKDADLYIGSMIERMKGEPDTAWHKGLKGMPAYINEALSLVPKELREPGKEGA